MFKLSRYFSICSAVGILAVVAALSLFYRHLAINALMAHETRANVAVTKVLANSLWPNYAEFVKNASGISSAALPRRDEIAELRAEVQRQMKGLNVVKLKIYDIDGLTVFSTEEKQIGEQSGLNPGFRRARNGRAASAITFRQEFGAFERTIYDRNLIESYIPIRTRETGPVEGVVELYSDVTELVEQLEATQRQIVIGVFVALSLLYVFLFLIVKRADGIIKAQEREHRATEAKIRHQAYHDSLTGLPNRQSFGERMQEAIRRATRAQVLVGLLFVDLDEFKLINDSLGHTAGDELLQMTAQRLQSCVRESDMVFRTGGDEFTVILENLRKPEDAALVARRIIESMSLPVALQEHEISSTTSIGIAIFPRDAVDAERLVKHADAAMYRAKEAGRNRYEFYTEGLNTRALERLTLEQGLRRALEHKQFILHYQPKVCLTSGKIVGTEALLSWQHPELGILTPDKFLSVLEDSGLILSVSEWVLRSACRQIKAWQSAGLPRMPVSVNIASRQFGSGLLVKTVREALADTGLEPRYLELELTERLLIDNADEAAGIMNELKRMGVLISIDDFGTGYSSLNYLKRFPIDTLKIDRSFIKDIFANEKDAAITSGIIALARNLRLGLIAEGVEDARELEFLQSRGCDQAQGYLFSRPLPPEEFQQMLATHSPGNVVAGTPDIAALPL